MSWFWGVLVAAVLPLVLAEVFDWFPWLARRVIRRAARLLPRGDSDRYEQEWLADLDALPGRRISTLLFAFRILITAPATRRELSGMRVGGARKRTLDIVVASFLLVAIAPTLAAVTVVVKLATGGPVFVARRCVGRDGQEFSLWRFRPIDGADGVGASRVRRVGGLLLRDVEAVPQLWNVVVGQMSLVGPRPLDPKSHHHLASRHGARQDLTPGLMDPHLMAPRSVSLDEIVELHDLYAREWSLWKDVKLLLYPAAVALRRARAMSRRRRGGRPGAR